MVMYAGKTEASSIINLFHHLKNQYDVQYKECIKVHIAQSKEH